MSTAYRDQQLACPACATWLDPTHAGESIIDVCPTCGGVWVDWFDGELATMARSAPNRRPAKVEHSSGDSACPRCRSPLASERYLDTRVDIFRCGDCAGAFVPFSSIDAVVNATPPSDPRLQRSVLSRLVDALSSWLRAD